MGVTQFRKIHSAVRLHVQVTNNPVVSHKSKLVFLKLPIMNVELLLDAISNRSQWFVMGHLRKE